jgi:hypothetical protein
MKRGFKDFFLEKTSRRVEPVPRQQDSPKVFLPVKLIPVVKCDNMKQMDGTA